jgi:hypothetical protein
VHYVESLKASVPFRRHLLRFDRQFNHRNLTTWCNWKWLDLVVSDQTLFSYILKETEVHLYRDNACNIAWHEIYLTWWYELVWQLVSWKNEGTYFTSQLHRSRIVFFSEERESGKSHQLLLYPKNRFGQLLRACTGLPDLTKKSPSCYITYMLPTINSSSYPGCVFQLLRYPTSGGKITLFDF